MELNLEEVAKFAAMNEQERIAMVKRDIQHCDSTTLEFILVLFENTKDYRVNWFVQTAKELLRERGGQ